MWYNEARMAIKQERGPVIPEDEKQEALKKLRKEAHRFMVTELQERLQRNPVPTDAELRLGAFREMLEPAVRDAVFELHRKGYTTESSGFTGDGQKQMIDGYFPLNEATIKAIEACGSHVTVRDVDPGNDVHETTIAFTPTSTNAEDIKAEWDRIVAVIPDTGTSGPVSFMGAPESFESRYAADRTDTTRARLERRLSLLKNDTDPVVVKEWEEELQKL